MRRQDYAIIAFLIAFAFFIWLRQTQWINTADDTLPILVALPLFAWLGTPWHIQEAKKNIPTAGIVVSALCFLVGIAANSTLLLAISWTVLLWSWLSIRTPTEKHPSIIKLLPLPILAFPWISLDADRVGWWFRLSGASVTAKIFSWLGFNVIQEGTHLTINQVPISVEVACAGLNTLQSMMIAGVAIAFIILGNSSRYWWNIPLLIVLAWAANTLRIIILCLAALLISPEFAVGAFHVWGGWAVILAMFLLCWLIFAYQKPETKREV